MMVMNTRTNETNRSVGSEEGGAVGGAGCECLVILVSNLPIHLLGYAENKGPVSSNRYQPAHYGMTTNKWANAYFVEVAF